MGGRNLLGRESEGHRRVFSNIDADSNSTKATAQTEESNLYLPLSTHTHTHPHTDYSMCTLNVLHAHIQLTAKAAIHHAVLPVLVRQLIRLFLQ